MRATIGLVGLLAVLATAYFVYHTDIGPMDNGKSALQNVDLVRVRADLLAFAQAERFYLPANGQYGTLEQLQQSGNLSRVPDRSSNAYTYEVEIEGSSHFRIIAKPTDPVGTGLPTLSIDETMRITP